MEGTTEHTEVHGKSLLVAFEETAMEWAMEVSMGVQERL